LIHQGQRGSSSFLIRICGELAREIQEFVKVRLAAHEYPREVAFVAELPMTVTGKVMRRVLRQQAAEEIAASKGKPA
jgi:acetyl-CoA synthetase